MKTIKLLIYGAVIITAVLSACSKNDSTTPATGSGSTAQTKTLQPDATTGKDACINSYYPSTNFGSNEDFDATAWTSGGVFYIARGLLQFDLSSIPTGATVSSATLSLYNDPTAVQTGGQHSTLSGSNTAYISKVNAAWDQSTVTWSNQPTTSTANQATIPMSTSNNEDYTNLDVTALVADMVKNPSSNYGMMISLVTEVQYRSLVFASSNHSNAAKRPKLVVNYK